MPYLELCWILPVINFSLSFCGFAKGFYPFQGHLLQNSDQNQIAINAVGFSCTWMNSAWTLRLEQGTRIAYLSSWISHRSPVRISERDLCNSLGRGGRLCTSTEILVVVKPSKEKFRKAYHVNFEPPPPESSKLIQNALSSSSAHTPSTPSKSQQTSVFELDHDAKKRLIIRLLRSKTSIFVSYRRINFEFYF